MIEKNIRLFWPGKKDGQQSEGTQSRSTAGVTRIEATLGQVVHQRSFFWTIYKHHGVLNTPWCFHPVVFLPSGLLISPGSPLGRKHPVITRVFASLPGVLTKVSKNKKMRHPRNTPGIPQVYPGYLGLKSSKNMASGRELFNDSRPGRVW